MQLKGVRSNVEVTGVSAKFKPCKSFGRSWSLLGFQANCHVKSISAELERTKGLGEFGAYNGFGRNWNLPRFRPKPEF